MKNIRHFLILITGIVLLGACQKELSFEGSNALNGQASGSLKDTSNNCFSSIVQGVYIRDSTLTDSNYVSVQAMITSPGYYLIYTDTKNGFSFKDSGYATTTGLQTFKLKGKGKPIDPGTTDFSVVFGTSVCSFSVVITGAVSGPAAVFSIGSTAGACTGTTIQGTYTAGVPLTSANTATLTVNVTTPGSYTIGAIGAGLSFSGSGTFTTTGSQTVVLQGSGTPATAGNNLLVVSAGGNSCSITVPVIAASGPGTINQSDSAWSFSQGSTSFRGRFDSAYTGTITGIGFGVQLKGASTNVSGDTLRLLIAFPGTTIQTGTYTTALSGAFDFYSKTLIYTASPFTSPAITTITVTSYDAVSKVIQGTFSGNAQNSLAVSVPITLGKFKAVVN